MLLRPLTRIKANDLCGVSVVVLECHLHPEQRQQQQQYMICMQDSRSYLSVTRHARMSGQVVTSKVQEAEE